MEVKLPDGSPLELSDGATGADAARAIGEGLAEAALAQRQDGEVRDLAAPLEDGARLEILTSKDTDDSLWLVRHDAAHVLATAVMELYPDVKIATGPPVEDGFYYDFEFPEDVKVSDGDLEQIEARMREHVEADEPFERWDVTVEEALERFREDQDYKVELVEDLVRDEGVETVSLYRNGPFTDLCRGPHGPSTKRIDAFKLTSVAGAYWRGRADRQMLTRIYGTAFLSKDDLDTYLERLEEARARDHRKLGRELELFMMSDLSPGAPFWQPAGTVIWNELIALWRSENADRGYREVRTPILYDADLWKQSGHWEKFRDQMYFTDIEGRKLGMKPMNLSRARPALRVGAPLLPRPADPLLGGGARPPPRAIRHAPRPAAGAPRHPGRRPHLLHPGAGRGRGDRLPGLRLLPLRPVRLRAAARALDASGAAHRQR
jgi:threonyl-tRNA synthetase